MSDIDWLEVLQSNQGFSRPERWVRYAEQHRFTKIRAVKLNFCPDCGASLGRKVGQYIYYSTLIGLRFCQPCGLIYADTSIDPKIVQRHFESVYKDEEYFLSCRQKIFNQIATIVDHYAPHGGSVIDIGGAKGHLMAIVNQRRPDLNLTVNDLSSVSIEWCKDHYGFETILGSASDLVVRKKFDVLTLIDVLYYEPKIAKLWNLLPGLISKRGTVIIRIPNRKSLLFVDQVLRCYFMPKSKREMASRIKFINPEHLYVFSMRYLVRRLKTAGFSQIQLVPSASPIADKKLYPLYFLFSQFSKAVHTISWGNLAISPSVVVVATRV